MDEGEIPILSTLNQDQMIILPSKNNGQLILPSMKKETGLIIVPSEKKIILPEAFNLQEQKLILDF